MTQSKSNTAAKRATAARKTADSNAAKIVHINAAARKADEAIETAKSNARKSAAAKTSKTQDDTQRVAVLIEQARGINTDDRAEITKLALQLDQRESELRKLDVPGRAMPATDDAPAVHKQRDEIVRKLRALNVGYDVIARIRQMPSSSNRGQVRLMCGLSRWDRVADDTAELTAAQRKTYDAARRDGALHDLALKMATVPAASKKRGAK